MAFETQTINIKTKKTLAKSEFSVETKVNIDADKPCKRVLSIFAVAEVSAFEQVDTDLSVSGRSQINVLYVDENGTLESVSGFADWQTTTKVAGENLRANCAVKEYYIESVDATGLTISLLHNLTVDGTTTDSFLALSETSEGYVSDVVSTKVEQICGLASGKFIVTDNIEMPAAQKILSVDGFAQVKEVASDIDKVTIDGSVDIKILYQTADGIAAQNKTIDFRQEVECMGALSNSVAAATLSQNSITATLELGDKNNLVLALGYTAFVEAYKTVEISCIADLYSLNKNLNTTTVCMDYSSFEAAKNFADTIVCTTNLENTNVDEVVSLINPTVDVAQCRLENHQAFFDGVVHAKLIYKNNQLEEYESMDISCPFVFKMDTELVGQISAQNVTAKISSAKIRSGKEIEVVLDLAVDFVTSNDCYLEFVKSVEELDEKVLSTSAISVYITKENERLFDVAKVLNVEPETITSQNAIEHDYFEGGQRIFVYSPLNVEF